MAPAPGGGTVVFRDGETAIAGCEAVAVDASGAAGCTTSALAEGTHQITAVFSGATGFATSTSAPLSHTVSAPAPPDPFAACTSGTAPEGYRSCEAATGPTACWGRRGPSCSSPVVATTRSSRAAADIVCGGNGNFQIAAGDGNDVVSGGPGDDIIDGCAGDDLLDGGAGRDRLSGGPGTDRGLDPDTTRTGIESTT